MVEALAERGLQQATEREIPFWIAIGRSFLGWCEIESGRVEAGIATLNAQRDCLDAAHLVSWTPTYLCWLADAYCRIDRPQEAGACLAEARSIIEQGGESWFEPECWRLEGKLARHRQPGDPIAARNYFERALSLARSRDDRGFGLRAAMGLAELLAQSGQPGEARVLLEEALRPFSNQPVSGDRAEARAFLRSLERAEGLSRVGPFG
jgi:tetratricopeptide (TPR) repeat protein